MSAAASETQVSNLGKGAQKSPTNKSKHKVGGKSKTSSASKDRSEYTERDFNKSSPNKISKSGEGGKQGFNLRNSYLTRSAHTPSSSGDNQIKVPKGKPNRKAQLSRIKKSEMEKQTLLVMDQMISHVKDFTTKERYFDYKKIANNIKAYKLSSSECKKLWEQFKARLRGQFKEGNEEMRQCRNECNEDFWTHHNNMFPNRLKIYMDSSTNESYVQELVEIANKFSDKNKTLYYDSLLEVNENENDNKLLPIVDEFKHLMKACDDSEDLEEFEQVLEKVNQEFKNKTVDPTQSMKDKHK